MSDLQRARDEMGGEYLMNAESAVIEVRHDQLERCSGESAYKSKCPSCSDGILLVARNQEDFSLHEYDRCIVCAQQVRYLDIDRLRMRDGGE